MHFAENQKSDNRMTATERLRLIASLLFFGIITIHGSDLFAQEKKSENSAGATKPKLIVVVSFDQMRGDFLEKFKDRFGRNGFARVLREGTSFSNCFFDHAVNLTCPGHATLLTGCYPDKSGIVSNDFFDRDLKKNCYCVEDSAAPVLKLPLAKNTGRSPNLLVVKTVGDILHESSEKSRVVSLSLKDRAAILMGGHTADVCLWFEPEAGGFTTSTYYKTPPWLGKLNSTIDPTRWAGSSWKADAIDGNSPKDDVEFEGKYPGGGRTFPHTITTRSSDDFWESYLCSPKSVDDLFTASLFAMEREKMGRDAETDILCVGVSTTDFIGHIFGPDSREIRELYSSVDLSLGRFITSLDRRIGRDNYVLVICSDHGVAPIPELMSQSGKPNGEISAGRLSSSEFVKKLNAHLKNVFGLESSSIVRDRMPSLFIDETVESTLKVSRRSIADSIISFCARYGGIGFAKKVVDGKVEGGFSDLEVDGLVNNDIYSSRTGDVIIFPKQYWIWSKHPATHGAPYDYDRHVPLIFFGGGVQHHLETGRVHVADLAPTIAKMLEVTLPLTSGTSLTIPMRKSK